MDFQIDHYRGHWSISVWDYSAPLGYEQTTIGEFDSEIACWNAWDMVMDAMKRKGW